MVNQLHVYAQDIMHELDYKSTDIIIDRINHDQTSNIILNFAWEGFPIQSWAKNYKRLIAGISNRNKKIFVVVNDCYDIDDIKRLNAPEISDLLAIDFFMYYVFCHHRYHCQPAWNDKATRFLYLNGRDKPERFRLLKKMTTHSRLMSSSIYSYHPDVDYETIMQNNTLYPEKITKQDYKNFQRTWARTLENFDYRLTNGCNLDAQWFKDSLFSLVVETNFNCWNPPWVTEKTYLPIINHRPFLIAGDIGTLTTLKNKGFETFEGILPEKNYDQQSNIGDKIDALISNTEYLLDHAQKHAQFIRKAVAHNYKTMLQCVIGIQTRLTDFIAKHGLDSDVDNLVPTGPWWIDTQWNIFYKNIKDESWPSCEMLHQFDDLPNFIQDECFQHSWFDRWINDIHPAYLRLPRARSTKIK
jgi:hypothetical protein